MVRIVHFSDWHGQFYDLPEADLYICTGDLLSSYPEIVEVEKTPGGMFAGDDFGMFGGGWTRKIDHKVEARKQNEWFERKFRSKGRTLRKFLGSPDAPVIVVRGNHDFIDLGPLFGGDVQEISKTYESHHACGLDIGGFRGINYIAGEWADETDPCKFYDILRSVPKNMDVMVSHSPPYNILDGRFNERWGIQAYAAWITEQMYVEEKLPKLFCFGYIHNDYQVMSWDDGTTFSNAATTHNIIDI